MQDLRVKLQVETAATDMEEETGSGEDTERVMARERERGRRRERERQRGKRRRRRRGWSVPPNRVCLGYTTSCSSDDQLINTIQS